MMCVCSYKCISGNVEWQSSQKDRCFVMWRSPQEWGKLILDWVTDCVYSYYYIVIVCIMIGQ